MTILASLPGSLCCRGESVKPGSAWFSAVLLCASAIAGWSSVALARHLRAGGIAENVAPVTKRVAVGPEQEELVIVFIGSPTCAYSSTRATKRDTRLVLRHARDWIGGNPLALRTIGISVSGKPSAGFELLRGVIEFDEMSIGGSWTSAGVERYLVKPFAGPDLTPQLLLLLREVPTGDWGAPSERLIARAVGAERINQFAASGFLAAVLDSAVADGLMPRPLVNETVR